MRAVVDTNILVRALLNPDGSVGPVVDLLRSGHYVFLYSEATLNELVDVLSRPRMVHRYGITADDVDAAFRGDDDVPSPGWLAAHRARHSRREGLVHALQRHGS